jgi:2-keto-4-pentenoate hydratase/2-oxohepta-3-ene-1,7-dioic acid hydratase in catechol pathway
MKIFCIGRNYALHAKELNNAIPEEPVIFMKPSTALLRDANPFYYPDFSSGIEYEAELVFKIAKNGKSVQEQFAWSYISEVGVGIDFTARDVQSKLKEKALPWELAKAFDNSAVIGDFISINEVPDKDKIAFELKKNGEIVQSGNSADMLFSVPQIIAFISRYFTLNTGDLIYSGTPAGVGKIAIGDHLEGFLEGKSMMNCTVK